MFISLKWKVLIVFSIILFSLTLVWLVTTLNKNLYSLEHSLKTNGQQYQLILNQLLKDDSFNNSQYAQFISRSKEVTNYQKETNEQDVQHLLNSTWFDWNFQLNLEYLAVLNSKREIVADVGQFTSEDERQKIREAYLGFSGESMKKPQNLVYCSSSCMQLVMEPFLYGNGELGVIVLGQNMSEQVSRYSQLSGADLAIVLSSKKSLDLKDASQSDLSETKVWALSHYKKMKPVLEDLFKTPDEELSVWNGVDRDYFYRKLTPNDLVQIGTPVSYFVIFQQKEQIKLYRQENWHSFIIAILAFVVAEIILFAVLLAPLKRFLKIASAQGYIPQRKYQQAVALISKEKSFFKDELTHLEQNTLKLAEELELLDDELLSSNSKLAHHVKMLTHSEEFQKQLFENINLFIVTLNLDNKIDTQNGLFSSYFEKDSEKNFPSFFQKAHEKDEFKIGQSQLVNGDIENYQHETTLKSKQNKLITIIWTYALVPDENGGQQVLCIGVDITERKKDEEKLYWIANHDSLTRIANRHAFQGKLNDLVQNQKTGTLIFIDINKFKQINDLYGHAVGDKVLLEIAGKLQNTVRGRGFVSRLSGDEFTIILPNITGETLPDMMSELLTVLNGVLVIDYGKQIEYEVSIGAAIFPEHGRDEEQLVIHADMAMYYAKNKADEKWHIFDQKDDRLVQMRLEQELIKLMKKALAEDLFELVFQPAMSIKNARVNHYEALIRLNYKDGSQCPPSLFIPLAEKSSLISKIDDWVVETVYKKMQSWLVEQPDLSIGINISAPSLQGKDFYLNLTKLNEKYQIPPESITIELTETSYIDNFGNVHSNLDYLSEKGFAIALDDFGVGYSSFNYLRELPLNYVKLDGSYVNGVSRKSENVAFIKSVVIMAKEFNIKTIAEYVETKEDLDVLRELGINYAQGFLVGKPSEKLLTKQQVAKAQKFI